MIKTHIAELQSVRGIASMAVLIGHSLDYYDTPKWFWHLSLVFNGRAAVVVFFVLSGFVLTRSLADARFDRGTLLRFYVKRLWRIYPALWAASLLGLLYLHYLHWNIPVPNASPGVLRQFRADRLDTLHIVASFAGMLAFILPQIWSVFVEIVASITMPFVAELAFNRRMALNAVLAGSVVVSFTLGAHTYYSLGLYFMDFVTGAAIASFAESRRIQPARLLGGIAAVVAALLMSLTQFLPLPYYDPTAHLIETCLAALLIALLVRGYASIPWLRAPLTVWIGNVSYSLYLLHYVALCVVVRGLVKLQGLLGVTINPMLLSLMATFGTLVIALPFAWVCFHFVEIPGIMLGRRIMSNATPVGSEGRLTSSNTLKAWPVGDSRRPS